MTYFELNFYEILIVAVLFAWLIRKYRCLSSMVFLFLWTIEYVCIFGISIGMPFNFISLHVSLLKFLIELHVQSQHHIKFTLLRLPLVFQYSDVVLVHHMLIIVISFQLIQLFQYSFIFFLDQMQLLTQEYILVGYFTNVCLSFYQKLLQQFKVCSLALECSILSLQGLNLFTQVRNFIQVLLNFVLMTPIVVALQFVHQTQDRIVHSLVYVVMTLIVQDA